MKKILLTIVAMMILFVGTNFTALTWWEKTIETSQKTQLNMGYGLLVPEGSYYSTKEGYTTSYEMEYKLTLEDTVDSFDLIVSLNDLKIGDVNYNPSSNIHGPFQVEITASSGEMVLEGYDTSIVKENSNIRFNNIFNNGEDVIINITFSLLENNNTSMPLNELMEAYNNLAGKIVTFNLIFEVPADI